MRKLVITEQRLSQGVSQFVVETSAGIRATGATLESALEKLWTPTERPPDAADWNPLKSIMQGIRDSDGGTQIHKGVQS